MKKGIVLVVTGAISFATGFVLGGRILVKMINDYKKRMERNLANMMLFNDWLELVYNGGHIEQYFHDNGYKKIMIYGNGYIGKRLEQALAGSDIQIIAIMDRSVPSDEDRKVIGIDSEIPDIDCIVITPVYYFDDIFGMLQEKTGVPLVSIQEVIEKV